MARFIYLLCFVSLFCRADSVSIGPSINASQIQGIYVAPTAPTNGQVMTYSSTTGKWAPAAASGGTTYTANQYGVALSSATNATLTILAPSSSTTAVLTSGGASANPTWSEPSAGTLPVSGIDMQNCGIKTAVAANALTISLVQADGATDPASGTSACSIAFRNATSATGSSTLVSATAATSVVISSGSTLGCISGVDCYLYVYAINNAGTIVLGVINGSKVDEGEVFTTTILAGSGNDDLESTLYSTATQTNKAVRLLARIRIQEATAGTWASNATTISNRPFKPYKWIVAATIGSGNPNLGLVTAASYVEMTSSAMVMTNLAGINRIPGWIPCSTTNPPTGLTCGAGNESVGISWIQPEPGNAEVCVTGMVQMNNTGGTDIEDYFEIVETGTNNQTIAQTGGAMGWRVTVAGDILDFGGQTCTIFSFSTSGRKVVRVFAAVYAGGSPTQNIWYTTQQPTQWTVVPID